MRAKEKRFEKDFTNVDSYKRRIEKIERTRKAKEEQLQQKLEEKRKACIEKSQKQEKEHEKLAKQNLKALDEYARRMNEKDEKTRKVIEVRTHLLKILNRW